ncbi:juvenile hormone esterase [Anabrus simplex]|uniref:juvenile hormone esterase n=1 Tax=Anabrus simplex TaxID=316456 RepID=UPI0035A27B1D
MKCVAVLLLTVLAAVRANDPVVRTAQGQLRGSVLRTVDGRDIFSFRGVPFAKPPVGDLRFKAPVPVESWDGIRNATEDGFACPQRWGSFGTRSEDCLFLNVYTTKLDVTTPRPVVVFFHPGGYFSVSGNSIWAGPNYLLDEDIVVVTANYRLGALGFLSLRDANLPGNYAMKDQVQVLRWVQENIAAFGGDAGSVTLAGYSAGAFSVILHMVSPMSQGLFHRAMAMSGSPLVEMVAGRPEDQARKQATLLNCTAEPVEEMVNCLRQKEARDFIGTFLSFREFANDPMLVFGPVVEPDLGDGTERFLTADPQELLLAGNFTKVPLMIGHTTMEFHWKGLQILQNSNWTEEMNSDFERIAPISFLYERGTEKSRRITAGLRKYYLKDQPITNASATGLGQLYSDSIIIFPVHRAAKLISAKNTAPVYFYKFSYAGRYSYVYDPLDSQRTYGVVHHDDLLYLFYNPTGSFKLFTPQDEEFPTMKKMIKIWSNFMKEGNPTPERTSLLSNVTWEPYTADNLKYLDIGSTLSMKEGLYSERIATWERLFPLPHTTNVKKG